MPNKQEATVICQICQLKKKLSNVVPAAIVREPIVELIKKTHPDWSSTGFICITDLNHFREEYVKDVLAKGKGDITVLEEQVIKSLKEHELVSTNINAEFNRKLTFGERMADKVAEYAGSWRFICIFFAALFIWIGINTVVLIQKPFDPYPFILLNLILSCIAAVQAPVIMMSQNRQEAKDRLRSEHDYRVNLKAELEIRHLHEKIDHLLLTQWQRLLEIQEVQTELMEQLVNKRKQ
ncbi:MAG: DUF1003 domain-containing protein [Dehalococcoidales bacterium]|nr:DUF1003 domain-containing protein [Dehalococcoidales bacterium]